MVFRTHCNPPYENRWWLIVWLSVEWGMTEIFEVKVMVLPWAAFLVSNGNNIVKNAHKRKQKSSKTFKSNRQCNIDTGTNKLQKYGFPCTLWALYDLQVIVVNVQLPSFFLGRIRLCFWRDPPGWPTVAENTNFSKDLNISESNDFEKL